MPQTLDLNRVIRDLDSLLQSTLDDQIDLETVTAGSLGMVNADLSQVKQVIPDLVINARDELPDGGKITIKTGNVYLGPGHALRRSKASEGRHIMIAVIATGTDIREDILPNIYEPFYATKEAGGSGLELPTFPGIVEQSSSSIEVYSEKGSTLLLKCTYHVKSETLFQRALKKPIP
ncbi:MAG: two-component system cell cycle sensor histidine kinase/response regulator CckA [Candidatus Azotimanducaceae bacterium]|jgi:two-component system cell cycle sensor histidine kinase/response regulator CckA